MAITWPAATALIELTLFEFMFWAVRLAGGFTGSSERPEFKSRQGSAAPQNMARSWSHPVAPPGCGGASDSSWTRPFPSVQRTVKTCLPGSKGQS